MEIAAEMDMTDHNSGKIAMAKLRMIEQVDTFCSKKHYRQQLIESKVTSGMKAWLCPYHDGTLPHVKVRTAVLRNLKKLELDPTDDEVKSLLKETQVGHYVMFLKMNADETVENRRLANQLVQKWANPLSSEDMQIRKQRDAQRVQQYKERKKKETQQPSPSVAVLNAGLAPGDPGYRNHATIPRASKLDYVTAPESTAREKQSAGAKNDALAKKLREVNKKAKVTSARAMKPSAEGRGILL
jgi:transcription factor SPN1